MPRRRLGVALLIPAPLDREIDGLRRACGDGALGKIRPHVTLVPPVNVREDAFDDALAVLRRAGAAVDPLVLRLGPAISFQPDAPVLYLDVGGDLDGLQRLRDAVFVAPLARKLTWPFVPHVTLAEDQPPDRLEAGVSALADYQVDVRVDRVHLLEERKDDDRGRVWEPVADAPLAPVVVVGRGGLPLELVVSATYDPDAQPLVVTARREGRVVGSATAHVGADTADLLGLEVVDGERGTGVGTQLLAVLEGALTDRRIGRLRAGTGAVDAFLIGRGWRPERENVLVRDLFQNSG
ncbi:MAG: GNAT family N-acetyltransferase [Actinomycetota bacterium]